MELSFSIPSKPSSSSSLPNSTKAPQSSGEAQPQFVRSKSLSDAPARRVIPPIPNAYLFRMDVTSADPAAMLYDLTLRSNSAAAADPNHRDQEGGDGGRRHALDISSLLDDRGFDEFADIPVESFAAAVLAGYGWSEGKGIGRNNKVGEVQSDSQQSDSEKIVAGRHAGQKGTVGERSGIKIMLQSSEEVQVGDDMVAELGSVAEEKCLKKLKELEIRDRDERKRKEEGKSRDSRREEIRSRDERRDSDEEAKPVEKSSGGGGGDRWPTSHRDFRGGKFYEQKGEVVDVVGPRTCDITMDGSSELVQGVDQEMLETAQPKHGGSVLVLCGKHKGVFGGPVERDMEAETGVVRDADSHALINVRLDQIAESVGDPTYLGY